MDKPNIPDIVSGRDETIRFFQVAHQSIDAEDSPLEALLRADREGWPSRQVQFLPRLCFALEGTRGSQGVRYALWKPLVEFIGEHFHFDVDEWLCGGEVALAFLPSPAADFVETIGPKIEAARLRSPFRSEDATFRVALNALCDVELELQLSDPAAANIASEITKKFTHRWRTGSLARPIEAELSEQLTRVASHSPGWALDACIQFLRQVQLGEEPPTAHSLTLASEDSLAADWLRPEEEEAWRDL
jgi:hypothetical protein